jgi:FdhE protein
MISAADRRLTHLQHEFPEWQPWLAVIERVVHESKDSRWQAYVPVRPTAASANIPILTGATIFVDTNETLRWFEKLLRLSGAVASAEAIELRRLDRGMLRNHVLELLQASICQSGRRIEDLALALNADVKALRAVTDLAALPLLHACRRRWSGLVSDGISQGYCPICGAWPALAEEQGIERSRKLRCGRCGTGWYGECLRCPYCEMIEHHQLTSLVQANGGTQRIDGCKRCHGYLKTFTVLQGSAPEAVLLDDLATVDLDIAALNAGYVRPANPGYDPGVRVSSLHAKCEV